MNVILYSKAFTHHSGGMDIEKCSKKLFRFDRSLG